MNWLRGILTCVLGCLLLGVTTVSVEAAPKENTAGKCGDGKDNDRDGDVDCDDSDCSSFCVPGGGVFTATATITQTFSSGCSRSDDYALIGCITSGIQNECTGVSSTAVTLLGPCTLLEETTDPDPLNPGEVQTGLWDVSFEATHPIVEPITTVTRFDTREFEVSGELFGSSTLNTKDYGKKGTNPNKLGVQGCFSMHDDPGVPGVPGTRSTTLDPVLPLDPGETMWLVCYDGLNPGANLNLRRRGGSLAQYLLNPENVTVRITRDLP